MFAIRSITNPIERQEMKHQQRSAPALVNGGWLLGLLALSGAAGVIMLTLRDVTSPTRELGILLVWILHALTGARAIAAGANAISREHTGQTWIPLVLTGVSARKILLGKWMAAMSQVAPWMLALGVLRLVMLPVFLLAFLNRFAWRTMYRTGPSSTSYSAFAELSLLEWAAVTAVVMTVVLTILEVMACTALGLAASAILRRGSAALIAAMVIRFTPVLLFAAFTRHEIGLGPSWRVLRFPPLALADSGSAPLYQLALPLTFWTERVHTDALPGLAMAAGLLLFIIIVSLVVTWAGVRATGALRAAPQPAPV